MLHKKNSEFCGNRHRLSLIKEYVQSEYSCPLRAGKRKEKMLPLNRILPRINTTDKKFQGTSGKLIRFTWLPKFCEFNLKIILIITIFNVQGDDLNQRCSSVGPSRRLLSAKNSFVGRYFLLRPKACTRKTILPGQRQAHKT